MADWGLHRWLAVGALCIVAAAAEAASGYNITQNDESKVAIGMTTADVQRTLGPPEQVFRYPRQPGPTWTYNVLGAPFGITKFDVDFGEDGRVVSANERIIGSIW